MRSRTFLRFSLRKMHTSSSSCSSLCPRLVMFANRQEWFDDVDNRPRLRTLRFHQHLLLAFVGDDATAGRAIPRTAQDPAESLIANSLAKSRGATMISMTHKAPVLRVRPCCYMTSSRAVPHHGCCMSDRPTQGFPASCFLLSRRCDRRRDRA